MYLLILYVQQSITNKQQTILHACLALNPSTLPHIQELMVCSRDAEAPTLQHCVAPAFVAGQKIAKTAVFLVLPFTIHWEEL